MANIFLAVAHRGTLHTLYTHNKERMYISGGKIKLVENPNVILTENYIILTGKILENTFGKDVINCVPVQEDIDCLQVFHPIITRSWGYRHAFVYLAVDYDVTGWYLQFQPMIACMQPQIFPYVRHQTAEMCLSAVAYDGNYLKFVKQQRYEICLTAVSNKWTALKYVNDKTDIICQTAVVNNGYALQYCPNQTLTLQLLAVSNQPDVLGQISNPSIDVIKIAVTTNGCSIKHVTEQTTEICKMAVKSTYMALLYINNQTKKLCDLAIKHVYACQTDNVFQRAVMSFNLIHSIRDYVLKRYVCLRLIHVFPEALDCIDPLDIDIHVRAATIEPGCIPHIRNRNIVEMCRKIVHKPLSPAEINDICTLTDIKTFEKEFNYKYLFNREIGK